jgi:hypothetical protein
MEDPRDVAAEDAGLNYIGLDGACNFNFFSLFFCLFFFSLCFVFIHQATLAAW